MHPIRTRKEICSDPESPTLCQSASSNRCVSVVVARVPEDVVVIAAKGPGRAVVTTEVAVVGQGCRRQGLGRASWGACCAMRWMQLTRCLCISLPGLNCCCRSCTDWPPPIPSSLSRLQLLTRLYAAPAPSTINICSFALSATALVDGVLQARK